MNNSKESNRRMQVSGNTNKGEQSVSEGWSSVLSQIDEDEGSKIKSNTISECVSISIPPWYQNFPPKKITIIGTKNCGKSSLLLTYLRNEWLDGAEFKTAQIHKETSKKSQSIVLESPPQLATPSSSASSSVNTPTTPNIQITKSSQNNNNQNNNNQNNNNSNNDNKNNNNNNNNILNTNVEAETKEETKIEETKIEEKKIEEKKIEEKKTEALNIAYQDVQSSSSTNLPESVNKENENHKPSSTNNEQDQTIEDSSKVNNTVEELEKQNKLLEAELKNAEHEREELRDMWKQERMEKLELEKALVALEAELIQMNQVHQQIAQLLSLPTPPPVMTPVSNTPNKTYMKSALLRCDSIQSLPKSGNSSPSGQGAHSSNLNDPSKGAVHKHTRSNTILASTFRLSSPLTARGNTNQREVTPMRMKKDEDASPTTYPVSRMSDVSDRVGNTSDDEDDESESTETEALGNSLEKTSTLHSSSQSDLELVKDDYLEKKEHQSVSDSDPHRPPPPPPPPPINLDKLMKMKTIAYHLMEGIRQFNEVKPKKGIQYLTENKVIENSPNIIASFVAQTANFKKSKIGEYIGDKQNEPILKQYCEYHARKMYRGVSFESAFRSFFTLFKLPSEGQQVTRIAEEFSNAYVKFNQGGGEIQDANQATFLACGILMLNTSLHNPNVPSKDRITKNTFYSMMESTNIPQTYLSTLFDNIKHNELQIITEDDSEDDEDISAPTRQTKSVGALDIFGKMRKPLLEKNISRSLLRSPTVSPNSPALSSHSAPNSPRVGVSEDAKTSQVDIIEPSILMSYKKKVIVDRLFHTFHLRDTDPIFDVNDDGNNNEMKKEIQKGDFFICVYSVGSEDSFQQIQIVIQKIITTKLEQLRASSKKKSSPSLKSEICSSIILVGTKADTKTKRQITFNQGAQIAIKFGVLFFESSVITNKNVQELFMEAYKTILRKQKQHYLSQQDRKGNKSSKKEKKKLHLTFNQILETPKIYI